MIHQFADGPFLRGCEVVPGLIIILVVEHDQLVQSLFEETLIDGGFEPAIITSGEETVALLKGHKDKYRALVTDINLRGKMGGWEVVQHARDIDPEFPVVHMSGAAAGDWASKGVPNSIMLSKLLRRPSFLLPSQTFSTVERRQVGGTAFFMRAVDVVVSANLTLYRPGSEVGQNATFYGVATTSAPPLQQLLKAANRIAVLALCLRVMPCRCGGHFR